MRLNKHIQYSVFGSQNSQNKKVKNLINTILDNIEPIKGESSNRETKGKQKRKLA